jgi:hypothetical protein
MEEKRGHRFVEHAVDLLPLVLALAGVGLMLYLWA